MKITLLTSNNSRHNYLVNILSEVCDKLFVLQETNTIFPGKVPGHYEQNQVFEKYFEQVLKAQEYLFGNCYIKSKKDISIFNMKMGDLNKLSLTKIQDFLESDLYIVFGASYIKGDLVDFLIKKKAINIHMGVSPYYRGCDCNFWAIKDGNPHLVGATIHMLTKGLDSGSILYHSISEYHENPFIYTMSTVKSAFLSIKKRLIDNSIFKLDSEEQKKDKEIRYSKKNDFTVMAAEEFMQNHQHNSFSHDFKLLKDPFLLREKEFLR
jgi:hypothetical protein